MALYRGPGGAGDATNDATSQAIIAVEAANAAVVSQAAAAGSASSAATSATNAASSATSAANSATTATTEASNATTSATNAANSAATATTKASEASTSATNAAASESAAASSATAAASSATSASNSATLATTKAAEASTSATSAASSANAAAASATTASTQATNASNSATAAATSATNAANSATAAATSATNAANSATTATTQATNAASSATAAATSASNAATSETNAAASATSAASSATTATTQSTNASNSASAASTSATNAANSATSASNSATAAAASAASINPTDLVHISGTETITGAKTFSTNPTISSGTANGVAYLNGSKVLTTGSALTFDGSNLGLGVAPSAWGTYKALQVNAAGLAGVSGNNMSLTSNAFYNGSNWAYISSTSATNYQQFNGQHIWQTAPSGTAGNAISFTQAMTLDASGNLLVGTTSTLNAVLNVVGRSGIGPCSLQVFANGDWATTFKNSSGTVVGSIAVNASSTAYNTSSDYRLKENIQPMTNALATISQLNPVTYNWKADGSDGQGFIAHELQAVVPDCVTGEKDAVDAEGKPVYQGIDTSFLVATLCKAIQEQQDQINELKAEVAALKAIN